MRVMEDSPYRDAEAVAVYDRVAVPAQFAAPARHLVAALRLRIGERVLDVGTGTGAAAAAAAAAVGAEGMVVGIDPSLPMLDRAWRRGTVCVAAARAQDLPFRERCFDAVTANFVLSHIDGAGEALANMTGVLRPGGRLGASSWAVGATLLSDVWNDVVAHFASVEELKQAFRIAVPGEAWFSDPANLQSALGEAGLRHIDVQRRQYAVTLAAADYLAMKQSGVEGALLRRRLGKLQWAAFTRRLAEQFQSRFGDAVPFVREVHIAVGTKYAV